MTDDQIDWICAILMSPASFTRAEREQAIVIFKEHCEKLKCLNRAGVR